MNIALGIVVAALGVLVGFGAYKVLLMEIKGPKEAWGRELNEGENIMPSPILGFITLALLGLGAYLVYKGVAQL